jgi:hypothetical protein
LWKSVFLFQAAVSSITRFPTATTARIRFWSFLTPLLGLPPEHQPWDNEGVSPDIARIREYEARRLAANEPKPPSVAAEIVAELVDHVATAVKRLTKTDKARAWLAERLQEGPVAQQVIEKGRRQRRLSRLSPH